MRTASEGRPVIDFPVPAGVITAMIDPVSGELAYEGQENAIEEVFLEGTAPNQVAREAGLLDPSSFLMEQFGAGDSAPSSDGEGVSP